MKKKFSGFTLIEMIIVIATFSIIMFGAMSLVNPVMRMMMNAETHENGSAAVKHISTILENELSSAEAITLYEVDADKAADAAAIGYCNDYASEFLQKYYPQILKSGSTATDVEYAKGKVHALVIYNGTKDTATGEYITKPKISRLKYYHLLPSGKEEESEFSLSQSTQAGYKTLINDENAKLELLGNKAYYDSFDFEIKLGYYDTVEEFSKTYNHETLSENMNSKNTNFTILATKHKNGSSNDRSYSFLSHSTMALVNMYKNVENYSRTLPGNTYFVLNTKGDGTKEIVDYLSQNAGLSAVRGFSTYTAPVTPEADAEGNIPEFYPNSPSYIIIYSYGKEIDTE